MDRLHISDTTLTRQILECAFEPRDLPVQLLGLASELHALKLVDLRLELLDLQIALGKLGTGLDQQGPQGFNIVRKFGAVRHVAQFGDRAKAGALRCDMASMIVACERWIPPLEA